MVSKQAPNPGEKRAAQAPLEDQGHVIAVVDQHLRAAAAERASDVHLEPKEDEVRVRFRIEGVLQERKALPLGLGIAVISRLKMMSKMDMAERRIPQDGNFGMVQAGSERHVRASTFPSAHGETMVLHISGTAMALKELRELGMPKAILPVVIEAANRPSGVILTTGPAGSGKTSTLYSLVQALDPVRRSIVTLEDGVEIKLASLTQGETNARAGFTFASGLHAIEGQDPDVILVGELPDFETAQTAFRCALTGRLVLSTLHAGSTVEAITRLLDMGVEPFAVSAGLSVIIAQRLVRKLCDACKKLEPSNAEAIATVLAFRQRRSGAALQAAGVQRVRHDRLPRQGRDLRGRGRGRRDARRHPFQEPDPRLPPAARRPPGPDPAPRRLGTRPRRRNHRRRSNASLLTR